MKLTIYVNQREMKALEERADEIQRLTAIKPSAAKIVQQQVVSDSTDITPVYLASPNRGERNLCIRLHDTDAERLKRNAEKNDMSLNKYIRTKIHNLFINA